MTVFGFPPPPARNRPAHRPAGPGAPLPHGPDQAGGQPGAQEEYRVKTVSIKTTIPEDHGLVVEVPPDLPAGPAEVVVTALAPEEPARTWTLGDLLASGLVGLWSDRTDIADSAKFARALRQAAERRGRAGD